MSKTIRRLINEPFWWLDLTDKQKTAIAHFIRGKTYKQIGGEMGISTMAARQHVMLATKKINDLVLVERKPRELPFLILNLIEKELNNE